MEDLQVIIYIIFGIIYLIFGALKKRRKGTTGPPPLFEDDETEVTRPGAPERRPQQTATHDEREPGSLEELLERYEEAANRAKRRASQKAEPMLEQAEAEFSPAAPEQPVYRNLEADALEQMQRTEHLKSLQESLPAKARAEVLSQEPAAFESPKRVKEQERGPRKIQRVRTNRPTRVSPPAQQIKNLLHSKKGLRQAMILTEVLNRKHF